MGTRSLATRALAVLLLSSPPLVGCGGEDTLGVADTDTDTDSPDAAGLGGEDVGSVPDVGPVSDVGPVPDVGPVSDAPGPSGDAGTPDDVTIADAGGVSSDAAPDSSPDDALDDASDAESDAEIDAATDAAPNPPPGPCEFDDLLTGGGEAATAPAEVEAGSFNLAIQADGGLWIAHDSAPDHRLVEAPAGQPLVVFGQADPHIEEHQGSFDIDEGFSHACETGAVTEVRHDPAGVLVLGGLSGPEACDGATWELRLCEPQAGHLRLEASASHPDLDHVQLTTTSSPDERIYGLGEQFPHDTLNLKGRTIPVIAQEGGVGRGHVPISPTVNAASPGSAGSEDTTYAPSPHYLTSTDRSLVLENTEISIFDFSDDDTLSIRLLGAPLVGRVLHGDGPLELIERLTEYTGRMPVPPAWVGEGAIVALARPLDETLSIVDDLQSHGVALAGVWNQTWSGISETFIGEQVLWNWVQNPNFHPGWGDFVDDLAADGIRTLCYINPMLRDPPPEALPVKRNLYQEAIDGGYFVQEPDGEPYLMRVTAFDVGLVDLSSEPAREWMKGVIKDELIDAAGCSGWMADFAEALPFDAVMGSGEPASAWHNRYPVEWARLNREAVEEAGKLGDVLFFNRSGFTRSPAYTLLMWQGDQLTTWDKYDGLVSALRGLIGGGLSGLALNHSDIGGYTSLSQFGLGYSREDELLKRWTEMAAFTAVMRTHEGNQPGANAQVYSDSEAMEHFARFSKIYRALGFYRDQLFEEAATKGWPVVRHLMLHYPDDPEAHEVDDQFLLGSELLVAPIKNKCWTWPFCPYDKDLYLPAGVWIHLWSGAEHGSDDAGTWIQVQAPIGEPAVFLRKGSPIETTLKTNLSAEGITAL